MIQDGPLPIQQTLTHRGALTTENIVVVAETFPRGLDLGIEFH